MLPSPCLTNVDQQLTTICINTKESKRLSRLKREEDAGSIAYSVLPYLHAVVEWWLVLLCVVWLSPLTSRKTVSGKIFLTFLTGNNRHWIFSCFFFSSRLVFFLLKKNKKMLGSSWVVSETAEIIDASQHTNDAAMWWLMMMLPATANLIFSHHRCTVGEKPLVLTTFILDPDELAAAEMAHGLNISLCRRNQE